MPPVTLSNVWDSVQRLSVEERRILTKLLMDMNNETEEVRKERVTKSIDQFFGGWSDDPRPIETIKSDIRGARTMNTSIL